MLVKLYKGTENKRMCNKAELKQSFEDVICFHGSHCLNFAAFLFLGLWLLALHLSRSSVVTLRSKSRDNVIRGSNCRETTDIV